MSMHEMPRCVFLISTSISITLSLRFRRIIRAAAVSVGHCVTSEIQDTIFKSSKSQGGTYLEILENCPIFLLGPLFPQGLNVQHVSVQLHTSLSFPTLYILLVQPSLSSSIQLLPSQKKLGSQEPNHPRINTSSRSPTHFSIVLPTSFHIFAQPNFFLSADLRVGSNFYCIFLTVRRLQESKRINYAHISITCNLSSNIYVCVLMLVLVCSGVLTKAFQSQRPFSRHS